MENLKVFEGELEKVIQDYLSETEKRTTFHITKEGSGYVVEVENKTSKAK